MHDTRTYVGGWLTRLHLRQLGKWYGLNLAVYVDTVEQRSTDLAHVPLYLSGRADTGVGGVTVIPAGTWVGGSNKHERTGILHCVFGAADGYDTVLKGLAKHFQSLLAELRQLVEEEHPIVGERHLARLGIGVAATQSNL